MSRELKLGSWVPGSTLCLSAGFQMLLGEEATGHCTSVPDGSIGDHWEGVSEHLPSDVGPWMGEAPPLPHPRSLYSEPSLPRGHSESGPGPSLTQSPIQPYPQDFSSSFHSSPTDLLAVLSTCQAHICRRAFALTVPSV